MMYVQQHYERTGKCTKIRDCEKLMSGYQSEHYWSSEWRTERHDLYLHRGPVWLLVCDSVHGRDGVDVSLQRASTHARPQVEGHAHHILASAGLRRLEDNTIGSLNSRRPAARGS